MPVALPYDVRLRLLRVTDARTDEQFGINMVGFKHMYRIYYTVTAYLGRNFYYLLYIFLNIMKVLHPKIYIFRPL